MTTKYEDLGKEGNDLLSKGFPSNAVKVTLENTFPEGFELKTNLDRTFKDGKESVGVSFEPTFTLNNNFKLKTKWLTKAEKEVSIELKNLGRVGTTFEVGTAEKSNSYFTALGYSDSNVNLSSKIFFPHDVEAPKANLDMNVYGVLRFPKDLYWGVHVNAKRAAKCVEGTSPDLDVNGRIHFANSNTTIFFDHLIGSKNPHSLGLLWTQKLNLTTTVATKYSISTDVNVSPTLESVVEQKCADGGIFKSKAFVLRKDKATNLDLKFGLSYTNKFTSYASYTVAAELNSSDLFGAKVGAEGAALGFEIKLK